MSDTNDSMGETLRRNIAELTAHQRVEADRAPTGERIASGFSGFAGSMTFVVLHLAIFALWIAINLGVLPILPRFDPTFGVLGMVASVEAIFLSTFVLISQNRMAAVADKRADLDLHVNLLAEHELTKLAGVIERIAERLDVPVDAPELAEIRQDVEPARVMEALDERRREEGLDH